VLVLVGSELRQLLIAPSLECLVTTERIPADDPRAMAPDQFIIAVAHEPEFGFAGPSWTATVAGASPRRSAGFRAILWFTLNRAEAAEGSTG